MIDLFIDPDFAAFLDVNHHKKDLWKDIADAYMKGRMSTAAPDLGRRAAFLASTDIPVFSVGCPKLMDMPDRDTFLWRPLIRCLRTYHNDPNYKWRPQYQRHGTCVGQGWKLGGDVGIAVACRLLGFSFPGRTAVSSPYPGGRVDVANKPGSWDGSWSEVTAEWVVEKGGIILLKDLGFTDDSREPDENNARAWTNTREGVPKKFEEVARYRPFQKRIPIHNAREAGKAIQQGFPVMRDSSYIASGKRDRNGFSPVSRSGGHCETYWGVRYNPFGLLDQNSWSESWGSGPKWPDDMPDGGVWLTEDDANRQIQDGGAYALVGPQGLEPLDPDVLDLLM